MLPDSTLYDGPDEIIIMKYVRSIRSAVLQERPEEVHCNYFFTVRIEGTFCQSKVLYNKYQTVALLSALYVDAGNI